MCRLVFVGVAVPVGAVGPTRLLLVDRTPLDAHGRMFGNGVHAGEVTASDHDSIETVDEFSDALMGELGSFEPLPGGWSGETFLAETGGERSVVRIYVRPSRRGPAAHEVDAALLHLVKGLIPVPEVLEVRQADPTAGLPAVLVTSYVSGVRGDLLLPELNDRDRTALGAQLGELLADLGGMPMLTAGPFVDGDLRIGSFDGADGLPGFVEELRPALAHFDVVEWEGLCEVALAAQTQLDTIGRHCLVHGDFNPKNFLVDPATLRITGLLDWEFAHAGHPFTDLGNLLRFERDAALVEAVLEAYSVRRAVVVDEALALARAADLWALVDLAARRHDNPVAARADARLRTIARGLDSDARRGVG